jgi:hypothetical protein
MTSSKRDGRNEKLWTGPRSCAQLRSIALCVCGMLPAVAGACTERTETRATPGSSAGTSSAGSSAIVASPASADAVDKRTTRGQMLSHYADTATMRKALVAGKLADYQAAAAAVARDDWAPSAGAKANEFTERARAKAVAAQTAPSLVAAAEALGALGDVCASCHLASGVPHPPIAPDEPIEASNPRMLAHAIAADRLWAGLTLPSDESWARGVQLLLEEPGLTAPSAEVSGAARLLRDLARQGERAEPDQRARVFADVLLTCSGCHERLGVVLEGGGVAR